MSDYFEKYKKYIVPALLFIVYAVFTIFTWGRWGNVIFDCFREAIIPQAMIDGKVLYTDITCIYPPLAYQINALLFKIFGNSLNVLYSASIVCCLTILTLFYKMALKKASLLATFTFILTIMEVFIFRIVSLDVGSWYFPYSYSFLYAFTFCIVAFYLYVLFKDTEDKKYLYLSALAAGISAACKFDFLLFILLIVYETVKRKEIKNLGYCLILFLVPLFCAFGIWFLTGGSIDGLVQYKDFLVNFANAPSVKAFNSHLLIQSFSLLSMTSLLVSSLIFLLNVIKILCIAVAFVFITKVFKNLFLRILTFAGVLVLLYYICIYQYINMLDLHINLLIVPYIVLISAAVIFLIKFKEKNYTDKEKFYFLISTVAFIMSYRVFTAVFISCTGNFIMVVYWFALVYLLIELLPEYFPALNKDFYKKLVCLTLVLYSLSFTIIYLHKLNYKKYRIDCPKGIFYTNASASVFNSTINYIRKNSNPEDTVVVMDEGPVINYCTDRPTNLKYYVLSPHMTDTYGQEKIISDFEKNMPEYVIITNNFYPLEGYWGIDYAQKIMNFVSENYNPVQKYEESESATGMKVTIFQKRPR